MNDFNALLKKLDTQLRRCFSQQPHLLWGGKGHPLPYEIEIVTCFVVAEVPCGYVAIHVCFCIAAVLGIVLRWPGVLQLSPATKRHFVNSTPKKNADPTFI